MIDIAQEKVERLDALLQAALEQAPFRRVNDARNDVERESGVRCRRPRRTPRK